MDRIQEVRKRESRGAQEGRRVEERSGGMEGGRKEGIASHRGRQAAAEEVSQFHSCGVWSVS